MNLMRNRKVNHTIRKLIKFESFPEIWQLLARVLGVQLIFKYFQKLNFFLIVNAWTAIAVLRSSFLIMNVHWVYRKFNAESENVVKSGQKLFQSGETWVFMAKNVVFWKKSYLGNGLRKKGAVGGILPHFGSSFTQFFFRFRPKSPCIYSYICIYIWKNLNFRNRFRMVWNGFPWR